MSRKESPNTSRLVQLHWQFDDGKTDFRAQREIRSNEGMREFIKETQETHPLPEGAIWLSVMERSPLFVYMEKKTNE